MARPVCAACGRPRSACLCGLRVPVTHRVPVCILQHPAEARQAKGSVDLLRLCLRDCRILALPEPARQDGPQDLPADVAQQVLGVPGSVLVYPGAALLPEAPPVPMGREVGQLVLIDATWRKSLRLLLAYPSLQALPRLALAPASPGLYAALRRAPQPGAQRSTLEAACLALAQVDGDAHGVEPLLQAFERWVRQAAAHREA